MSLNTTILMIFLTVWLILTVYELYNINRFNLKFFNYGVTIFRTEITPRFINWKGFDGIYEEKEGKFVFIPEIKKGYFTTIFRFYRRYGLLGVQSIFPITIYGYFESVNDKLTIKYKVSIRLVVIIGIICFLWFLIPVMSKNFSSIVVSFVGIAVTGLFVYLIYVFKKIKMKGLEDEIKCLLKVKL